MKIVFYILIYFVAISSYAQSILLDPRATSQANLLTKGSLALQKTTTFSTTATHTAVNRGEASILKFNSGTIHGIAGGTDGLMLYIINTGTSILTISHQNTNASTSNRIISPTGFAFQVSPNGGAVTLIYDGTTINRWRIINVPTEPWNVFGQNSTNATNFVGTTTAQSLYLKTNNVVRMHLNSDGNVGIGSIVSDKKLHLWRGASGVTSTTDVSTLFEDNASHSIALYAPETQNNRFRFTKPSNNITGFTLSENNSFSVYNNDKYSIFSNSSGKVELGDVDVTNRNIKLDQSLAYRYVSDDVCSIIEASGCYPTNLVNSSVLREYSLNSNIELRNLIPRDVNEAMILHIFFEDASTSSTPQLIIKNNWLPGIPSLFKIFTGAGGDLTITGNGGATLIYNPHRAAWFVVDWRE